MEPLVSSISGIVPAVTPPIEIFARDIEFPDEVFKAAGTLSSDGVFTFEYPLVALDSRYPCPDEDLREIEFSHLSLPGDALRPVRIVGVLKGFIGYWEDPENGPHSKPMLFTDFTEANGYGEEDRRSIDALPIGVTWSSPALHGHRIVRHDNGDAFEHSADFLTTQATRNSP